MSKWPKVMIAIVMVLALVVVGCAPKEAAPTTEVEKVITIGILGSLTGPLRSIGEGAIACNDYFTELNTTEGGVKYTDPQTGKEEVVAVRVLMGDHAWDAAKCMSLYERFKAEGMQLVFANGSAPTAVIYSACARDHIPGIQIDTTTDPFIYEIEEPYMSMAAPSMAVNGGPFCWAFSNRWKNAGNTGKIKIGQIAADVATRRVYSVPELGFEDYLNKVLGDDVDFLGTVYMPVAPVDVKAELTPFIEQHADLVLVDHWGSGACRVLMHDALDLEMHKKGIDLCIEWLPTDVPLAEPEMFDEYNEYSEVTCLSQCWQGSEPPEVVNDPRFPGLKLAYDLCAKYHDGVKPEERAGWYYIAAVKDAMIGAQVIRETLDETGYANFTTEKLRENLFHIGTIDSGGILPTYDPDPDCFMSYPCSIINEIHNGHCMVEPWKNPWSFVVGYTLYPGLNVKIADEYKDLVEFPPDPFRGE